MPSKCDDRHQSSCSHLASEIRKHLTPTTHNKMQSNITLQTDCNLHLKCEWTTTNSSRSSLTVTFSHFLFISKVSYFHTVLDSTVQYSQAIYLHAGTAGDWLEIQFLDNINMQEINTSLLPYIYIVWLLFFFFSFFYQVIYTLTRSLVIFFLTWKYFHLLLPLIQPS